MIDGTTQKIAEYGKLVSEEYDADVYIYSGEISDQGYGKLVESIALHGTDRRNILLILVTNGGSANNAYQIARVLHKTYKNFILYTPSYCKSAGTLIALGAHKLIMDQFSELGPLDVQLLEQNEIGARKSGLVTRSAFEGLEEQSFDLFEHFMLRMLRRSGGLVSFKVAAELSVNLTSALMSPVFGQINPFIVGKDRRDLEVALHYGLRLVQASGNARPSTVDHLVSHYPSHDFIIDDEEAKELFDVVDVPTQALYRLVGAIGHDAYNEADEAAVEPLHCLLDALGGDQNENEADEEACAEPQREGSPSGPEMDVSRGADRTGNSDSPRSDGDVGGAEAPSPSAPKRARRNGSSSARA
ncbi:SDH family Clp fold serine proteinase [Xanthobacter versatilis]|uniref:SDH family Clp fold serine proteinase n=1 Tax=Xanthobacter autotrophicus (strain ATCC BAA-1158 / Py2) TaxID=78245 RepID=UPI00372868D9